MGVNASNHRRTLSNISSTSSNINSGFHLENDEISDIYQFNNLNINNTNSATPNRMRVYENIPFPTQLQHQSIVKNQQTSNDITSNVLERPMTLSFEHANQTKFRSSLKKHTVSRTTSSSGTPTNPTPPDSLTSDDSSYLSARDGSSISSQSRVRFSPETLLDLPIQGQSQDPTIPLQAAKRMSRRITHSSGGETSS